MYFVKKTEVKKFNEIDTTIFETALEIMRSHGSVNDGRYGLRIAYSDDCRRYA